MRYRVRPAIWGHPRAGGKPTRSHPPFDGGGHFRAGGETQYSATPEMTKVGPSPRRRGNHLAARHVEGEPGAIPAQAGKPFQYVPPPAIEEGLSPRRRETVATAAMLERDAGPSRAGGETAFFEEAHRLIRGHPRAGGETICAATSSFLVAGPSPRRRGNPGTHVRGTPRPGAIPAQAGKPCSTCPRRCAWRGHPAKAGKLIRAQSNAHLEGAIPAQAGKPWSTRFAPPRCRGHPRAGGETSLYQRRLIRMPGPSPRRRGNLGVGDRREHRGGAIPAQAGKPQ